VLGVIRLLVIKLLT